MTREEKAQEFARNCAEYNNLPIEVEHLLHTAFIVGYNERDDEEKNPWHKVLEEKDMPKEETFMVTYPAKYCPDYCYYEKHLNKWVVNNLAFPFEKFKKLYTHWMEIPEIKED